ncbi:hypothetical protein HMPREF9694_05569 [Klebsiella michiganensis]|nr:hypothetical protein HMPREF9694_05569 [Klebsiella michiganensis]
MVDCADDSLEYNEEDEHRWSDVIGSVWLPGNIPLYRG